MAKGRKTVGLDLDAFQALNALAIKQNKKEREVKQKKAGVRAQELLERKFWALAVGAETMKGGRQKEIYNPGTVVNIVLALVNAGFSPERIARECKINVRGKRFQWDIIRDAVIAGFESSAGDNCNEASACIIFGYEPNIVETVELGEIEETTEELPLLAEVG